ncbi:1,4-dihydroxy-2-naphthoate polyprenyltransferase [Aquibacillus sp. 3ASR75-11]|uniref:1,4-dihydroxy-2-naphthoate octaprenyltransferase n=1 Tax=Terrihalobacillus insolitus TaxID=2950438 RepID=A0A9X3WSB9_9BACI|nr:1,4-dihydroxy-2-naphthoate polyprenyltransferase [Terrihalobacillus insolitus]MDC3412396.1 1,4-dihydroxy-2-naphthoate polyprenyltransferase [Terrihalobacillus insolitus]MDC3422911.1 1,4-dihydroxy-2-naphthoate polyprenyltransferase [Terrihalobacillus insolitus]
MESLEQKDIRGALNEKEGFQIWWRLLRPHTLTASFVPVLIGTTLAALDYQVRFELFLAMLVASMLIQSATNMFNEYYDYVRGLDNENSVGIGGTIVRDGISPKTVLGLALSFFAVAIILGIYISISSSWWIALIGMISMLCGFLYTGGPYPIAYTPFGELFAGFFMGTVIIGISYYIQASTITGSVVLVSIPIALLIGTILLSNNIRDLDGDKENGRKTIAILLGRKKARNLLGSLFAISYLLTVGYVVIGMIPIWSLLTFLSLKKARDAYQGFKHKTMPIDMMPAMKATAQTNTFYGLLLGLSLLIQLLYPLSF